MLQPRFEPSTSRLRIWSVTDYYLVCEAIGTAAIPGLLCQPRVIVKMIVEKQMECGLTGKTKVLGENLPQRHFCPSQNPTWPDAGLNPGRRGGKPATNRLSYGAAWALLILQPVLQSRSRITVKVASNMTSISLAKENISCSWTQFSDGGLPLQQNGDGQYERGVPDRH
jgi:hypothetical protein